MKGFSKLLAISCFCSISGSLRAVFEKQGFCFFPRAEAFGSSLERDLSVGEAHGENFAFLVSDVAFC